MPFRLAQCVGDWALVTGASAGIGREFARQLAARRMNVVIVARREPLLQALAAEIEQAHGVRVLPVALDLSTPGAGQALSTRVEDLGDVRLRLVVNNAACGRWGPFDAAQASRYAEIVQLNCAAVVEVAVAVLPVLVRSAPSALVNVSSQAAYQPVPYMAVYGASKAFVQSFARRCTKSWRMRACWCKPWCRRPRRPNSTSAPARTRAPSSSVAPLPLWLPLHSPGWSAELRSPATRRGCGSSGSLPGCFARSSCFGKLPVVPPAIGMTNEPARRVQ